MQPSVHAAAQARKDLPVSLAALYDKINNTEPELARAVVTGSAQRLNPLVQEVRKTHKPVFPVLTDLREAGRVDTGTVYEQDVEIGTGRRR